jgi:hypothetical protein
VLIARFRIDGPYVVEVIRHKRKARRVLFNSIKGAVIVFGLGLTVFAYAQGDSAVAVFFIVACIVLLFAHRIDYWRAKRAVRKSPFNDEIVTMNFSEEEVQMRSSQSESVLKWTVFTKAIQFDDGFLLCQGPMALTWIARTALDAPADFATLETLLRSKIAHYITLE